jgi:hypothetical protein
MMLKLWRKYEGTLEQYLQVVLAEGWSFLLLSGDKKNVAEIVSFDVTCSCSLHVLVEIRKFFLQK